MPVEFFPLLRNTIVSFSLQMYMHLNNSVNICEADIFFNFWSFSIAMVISPEMEEMLCRWAIAFQEYDFSINIARSL